MGVDNSISSHQNTDNDSHRAALAQSKRETVTGHDAESARAAQIALEKLSAMASADPLANPPSLKPPALPPYLDMTDPYISVTGTLGKTYDFVSGVADIAAQAAAGTAVAAYNAITEHPGQACLTIAEGAVVGVALVAAAPLVAAAGAGAAVVAGVGLAADLAIVGLTGVGAATTAVDLINASSAAEQSASVLINKSAHTNAEIAAAREDVQSKLGPAGLETAGAALLFAGGITSGIKIATRISIAFKTSDIIVPPAIGIEPVAPPVVAAARPATADIVQSAPLTTSAPAPPPPTTSAARSMASESPASQPTSPTAAGGLEGAHAHEGEGPLSSEGRDRAIAGNSESSLMPPHTVERFGSRVDKFIEARQKKFDVIEADARILELSGRALDFHSALGKELFRGHFDLEDSRPTLSTDQLSDVNAMRQRLAQHPELAKGYETYLQDLDEQKQLLAQRSAELETRRQGLAHIINDDAKKLFPDAVVPKFKVGRVASNADKRAEYYDGYVNIKDNDIATADPFFKALEENNLPARLLHEMKHGEQDGLLVRRHIDLVTDGDTTGRPLTTAEKGVIRDSMSSKFGRQFPDELIDDINAQRQGRVLTPDEINRAESLERSNISQKNDYYRRKFDNERVAELKSEVQRLEDTPEIGANTLKDGDTIDYLFMDNVPAEVQQLQREYATLPVESDGEPKYDEQFNLRSANILLTALKGALSEAREKALKSYVQYRGWAHEQESWDISEEAEERLGVPADKKRQATGLNKLLEDVLPEHDAVPLKVENVLNLENQRLFTALEALRHATTPEQDAAYQKVLAMIMHEQDSLMRPSLRQRFLNKLYDVMDQPLSPELREAYRDIASMLENE